MKKYITIIILSLLLIAIISGCTQTDEPIPTPEVPVSTPTPTPTPPPAPPPEIIEIIKEIEWISPMLSISVAENEATVFEGELGLIDTNDFGREFRGIVATEIPEEGESVVPAKLSGAELEALGAVKMTANFAYEGEDEYNIRFRVRVDMFQGHSVTSFSLGAVTGLVVLWEDEDGIWWNMRRTGWGGEFTGGTDTPGWFYEAGHDRAGEPYPVFTFDINKENAKNFATQDFYIVFLEEAPLRVNDAGIVTDETSGYIITFLAEQPDEDGHFHGFSILASASTYIHIPADADSYADSHDDHSHDHHSH